MLKEEINIGRKVRYIGHIEFGGVKTGSVGYIIEDYKTGIMVGWDLPERPYPKDKAPEEVAAMYAIWERCPERDGFSYDELFLLTVLFSVKCIECKKIIDTPWKDYQRYDFVCGDCVYKKIMHKE